MKAIIKKRPIPGQPWYQGLEIKEKPEPQIKNAHDVKIKVMAASICGTDISIYKGTQALQSSMAGNEAQEVILGHEFSGIIVEAGPVARQLITEKLYSKKFNQPAIAAFLSSHKKEELTR